LWPLRLLAPLPEALLFRFRCLRTRRHTLIRLLTPPLAPRLHISATRTATTQPRLHQPRENRKRRRDPHEHKQRYADFRANVDFADARDGVAEDDEHDGCDDGCDGDDECVEEGENGGEQGEPAREDGEGHEEDEDGGEAGAGEEEAEHHARD
jgi:hypothetical protein